MTSRLKMTFLRYQTGVEIITCFINARKSSSDAAWKILEKIQLA